MINGLEDENLGVFGSSGLCVSLVRKANKSVISTPSRCATLREIPPRSNSSGPHLWETLLEFYHEEHEDHEEIWPPAKQDHCCFFFMSFMTFMVNSPIGERSPPCYVSFLTFGEFHDLPQKTQKSQKKK